MSESSQVTTDQLTHRVSQILLAVALTVGFIAATRTSQLSSLSEELFRGMNLELPFLTKLLIISPFNKLVFPAILIALVAKESLLKDNLMSKLTANGVGLVLIFALRELYFQASMLPLIQLIGNLG